MKKYPRRFLRRPAKQEIHHTYVEMPGGIYEAKQTEEQRREFEILWLEEIKDRSVSEVMLLKMKQSGKELDSLMRRNAQSSTSRTPSNGVSGLNME